VRQLADPVLDVVVAQVAEVGTEGVGLDAVGAGGQIGLVHPADHVGTGHVEDLVAALETLEIGVHVEVGSLEHCAHCPVGDEDAISQRGKEGIRHLTRLVRVPAAAE
jgi:hypothetical protein